MTAVATIPHEKFNLAKLETATLPETFADMEKLLKEAGIIVEHASGVLADEWPLVEKKRLVNVPFILATWTVSKADDPNNAGSGQYIVCRGMTKDGKRFRFADGSTGIMAQLVKLTKERIADGGYSAPNAGLLVPAGLTASEYSFIDEKGKATPATTFYLSNGE